MKDLAHNIPKTRAGARLLARDFVGILCASTRKLVPTTHLSRLQMVVFHNCL